MCDSKMAESPHVSLPVYHNKHVVAHCLIDASDAHLFDDGVIFSFTARGRPIFKRAGTDTKIKVHTLIMEGNKDDIVIDHINGDFYDNRRCNLRFATRSLNAHNTPARASSGYKGVRYLHGRWRAIVGADGKKHHLGYYDTAENAARVVDDFLIKTYGDDARLNFPDERGREPMTKAAFTPRRKDPTLPRGIGYTAVTGYTVCMKPFKKRSWKDREKAFAYYEECLQKRKQSVFSERIENGEIKCFNAKGDVVARTKVDAELLEEVALMKPAFSAGRVLVVGPSGTSGTLHRWIFERLHPDAERPPHIDHINQDPLDNRGCNLRASYSSANNHNKRKRDDTSSRFRGVTKIGKCWHVAIKKDGVMHQTTCRTERFAALVYNKIAETLYGELAVQNDVGERESIVQAEEQAKNERIRRTPTKKVPRSYSSSKYRGVHKRGERSWRMHAVVHGKKVIKSYKTEKDAARAYNATVKAAYGDNCMQNDVSDDESA